jgi:hypothetical protein
MKGEVGKNISVLLRISKKDIHAAKSRTNKTFKYAIDLKKIFLPH